MHTPDRAHNFHRTKNKRVFLAKDCSRRAYGECELWKVLCDSHIIDIPYERIALQPDELCVQLNSTLNNLLDKY